MEKDSPSSNRVVLFNSKAFHPLEQASLSALFHLLQAALPLQEKLHNRVSGVDLCAFGVRCHKRLQLRRKRLRFCWGRRVNIRLIRVLEKTDIWFKTDILFSQKNVLQINSAVLKQN